MNPRSRCYGIVRLHVESFWKHLEESNSFPRKDEERYLADKWCYLLSEIYVKTH